jgi:dynein heavy chain
MRWPHDALHTVAASFLSSLAGLEPGLAAALPTLCVQFHNSTHALAAKFLEQQRRHYYVTPTSYLELLQV